MTYKIDEVYTIKCKPSFASLSAGTPHGLVQTRTLAGKYLWNMKEHNENGISNLNPPREPHFFHFSPAMSLRQSHKQKFIGTEVHPLLLSHAMKTSSWNLQRWIPVLARLQDFDIPSCNLSGHGALISCQISASLYLSSFRVSAVIAMTKSSQRCGPFEEHPTRDVLPMTSNG